MDSKRERAGLLSIDKLDFLTQSFSPPPMSHARPRQGHYAKDSDPHRDTREASPYSDQKHQSSDGHLSSDSESGERPRHGPSSSSRRRSSPKARSSSRSPRRTHKRQQTDPTAAWMDKLVAMELLNRELKKENARLKARARTAPTSDDESDPFPRRDSSRSSSRSSSRHPRESTSSAAEAEPIVNGISLRAADRQADIFWDLIKNETAVRGSGYPADVWATMIAQPAYLDVAHDFSDIGSHCLTPDGVPMPGCAGGRPASAGKRALPPDPAYALIHSTAKTIIKQLFVVNLPPQKQPHLDLMGLVFEHLINAAQNSAPGDRMARAYDNPTAPSVYVRPGRLAVAMVVRYMSYQRERWRKAVKAADQLAEEMRQNGGSRRPRKTVSKKPSKLNPSYEKLKAPGQNLQDSAASAFSNLPKNLPEFVKRGLPPSPTRERQIDRHDGDVQMTGDYHQDHQDQSSQAARSTPHNPTSPRRHDKPAESDLAQSRVPTPNTHAVQPTPATMDDSGDNAGFVALDENEEDAIVSSTTGGIAVACPPRVLEKPDGKNKPDMLTAKSASDIKTDILPGTPPAKGTVDAPLSPVVESSPPGYRPVPVQNVKKLTKKELKAAQSARLRAANPNKAAGGKNKPVAADESAASSDGGEDQDEEDGSQEGTDGGTEVDEADLKATRASNKRTQAQQRTKSTTSKSKDAKKLITPASRAKKGATEAAGSPPPPPATRTTTVSKPRTGKVGKVGKVALPDAQPSQTGGGRPLKRYRTNQEDEMEAQNEDGGDKRRSARHRGNVGEPQGECKFESSDLHSNPSITSHFWPSV
ncbi:hypothetical protein P7C70_g7707, partial [Phenoliferia sp. Uapishka_3]